MISVPTNIINYFTKLKNKKAIIYINIENNNELKITYEELAKLLISGNNYFYKNKYKKNDNICYLFDNSPEVIILNLICLINGFTSCPFDLRCDTEEILFKKLEQTKPKIFFYRTNTLSKEFISNIEEQLKIKTFSVKDIFNLQEIFQNNYNKSKKLISKRDILFILYTSGTTGFPKGVMISRKNLYFGIKQISNWLKIKKTDVFYIVLPLYHINSIMYSLTTLFSQGTIIIPSRYSSSIFFHHIAKHKATMTSIVPTINYDLLKQKELFKKIKKNIILKLIQIGSAPVSPTHAFEFFKNFNIPLIQGYGLTETTHRVTGIPINLNKNTYIQLLKENSIGIEQKYSKIKIVDKNKNEIKKENSIGEITVKGNCIMKGYFHQKKLSKQIIKKNYFWTGDVGYYKLINNKKYFFILGRSKEIIIKGGINISPIYVEEQLRKILPWAENIIVVGFSHDRYGEEIGVIVVPKNKQSTKQINDFKDQLKKFKIPSLSKYETPQSLIVTSENKVSKTQIGKIQHIKVKEFFEKELINNYKKNFKS